jgi:hypothetical protein
MTIASVLTGEIGKGLFLEGLREMAGNLATWRRNPTVRLMDATRSKGRILAFVKGLRISARVAYVVRNMLSRYSEIEVSWGHVVDGEGKSCSAECDIIVHHKGHIQKWNGGDNPIMDFRFIHCDQVIAVISCKAFAKSIDEEYPSLLMPYGVRHVLLVAECCAPRNVKALQKKAVTAGYRGFYPLYLYDSKKFSDSQDETIHLAFANDLLQIAEDATGGGVKKKQSGKRSK